MLTLHCREKKTVDSVLDSLRLPVADCKDFGRLWRLWQTVAACTVCGRLWRQWRLGQTAGPCDRLCQTVRACVRL
jgi:hypothetical protein